MIMKKLLSLILAMALLCASIPAFAEETPAHVLVVYFSHAGENYNVGVIEEGNTAKMGKIIAEQLGADVFELVPVVPYPEDYDSCLDIATEEQRTDARPEYEGGIENWDQYDTVFIGYPIWWGEIPNIVYTFMEAYDFTGKTIIPFATSGGSPIGDAKAYLGVSAPGAVFKEGRRIGGIKELDALKIWMEGMV
jgi:flavodoxin